MEEVKKTSKSKNFYLTIYNYIKDHNKLPDNEFLDLPEKNFSQRLNYYISSLKKAGFIKKIGYGVWQTEKEFSEEKLKEVKTTKKITTQHTKPQPTIRGHAFQFNIKLPKIHNWKKRRDFLDKNNIAYENLKIIGNGEKIHFKGKKVWLTDKSIIIFEKTSFLSDSAAGSKSYAIYDMLSLLKSLESLFNVSFMINKGYRFKVSKQHYARLSCSLANQYRKDGKKLYVKQEDGTTWLWTDYSLNIDETETGNTERSDKDMDNHIHPFLNSLRKAEGYTPEFVTNTLGQLIKYQEYYAKNLNSHVKAVQRLGIGVEGLRNDLKNLKKQIGQKKLKEWF